MFPLLLIAGAALGFFVLSSKKGASGDAATARALGAADSEGMGVFGTAHPAPKPLVVTPAIAAAAKAAGMTPAQYQQAVMNIAKGVGASTVAAVKARVAAIGSIAKGVGASAAAAATALATAAKNAGLTVPQYQAAIANIAKGVGARATASAQATQVNKLQNLSSLLVRPAPPTSVIGHVVPNWLSSGASLETQSFTVGDRIQAANGKGALILQTDGNLVLQRSDGVVLWNADTVGRPLVRATMQEDGNFVMYDASGQDNGNTWATHTDGNPGAYMILQDDGNLVIYVGESPIWATNTGSPGHEWVGSERVTKTIWDLPGEAIQHVEDRVTEINNWIRTLPLGIGAVTSSLEDDIVDFAHTKVGGFILSLVSSVVAYALIMYGGLAMSAAMQNFLAVTAFSMPSLARGDAIGTSYANGLLIALKVAANAVGEGDAFEDDVAALTSNITIPPELLEAVQKLVQLYDDAGRLAGKMAGVLPDAPQVVLNGMANQIGLPVPASPDTVAAYYAGRVGVPDVVARAVLNASLGLPPPPELIKGYDKTGNLVVDKAQSDMVSAATASAQVLH